MRKKTVPGALMLLAVIVVAGVLVARPWRRGTPAAASLSLSGTIEVTETNAGFTAPGRVTRLFAGEGQAIAAGDRLAALDDEEARQQAAQARAAVEEAAAVLADLEAGAREQEIEQARQRVSALAAELLRAEQDLLRADILAKNGAIPAAELDAARSLRNRLRAECTGAGEALALLEEGPRPEQVRAAEARVRQARAAAAAAVRRLADRELLSPVSGVVLRKNAEEGETVAAGLPVYTIGDLGKPWVKVYVRETDLGKVTLGGEARVTVDSFPGKEYGGSVTYISSEAEFTPRNVQTQEERVKLVFAVKVGVDNERGELKPGMPADVVLLLP